ncbi:MAG TPA: dienelactone hydrolase family protein [Nitrososphaera sp.]|nr:dienelactone hydrolase family protein [Nitrososphaera sp.]
MKALPVLIAALLLTTLVSMTGSGHAAVLHEVSTATVHVTGPAALKGSIANVQLDSDGNPEWVQSGIWVLRLRPSTSDSDIPTAQFIARMSMVMVDGTAMHSHTITDFTLTNATMEGNPTHVFEGTATVSMRDGPVSDVPVTIKIFNDAVIGIWLDPEALDSHFGDGPVYGTLAPSSRTKMVDLREGMTMSDRPANATSTDLEKSSINYYGNATGYLVQPAGETNLPAVVVIHEWWGLNQHIKDAADRLAAEGYVVLAADLYSSEVATAPDRARELSSSVRDDPYGAMNNLNAAVEYAAALPNVNASRIAALGWCFGGGQSMLLALNAERPLAATVIYYGTLVTDEERLSVIEWPVLGIFGSEDQSIPVATVEEFESALDVNGIKEEIYIYEGVGHAFANPSGDNYAPEETADAWEKTLAFLEKYV